MRAIGGVSFETIQISVQDNWQIDMIDVGTYWLYIPTTQLRREGGREGGCSLNSAVRDHLCNIRAWKTCLSADRRSFSVPYVQRYTSRGNIPERGLYIIQYLPT